MVYECFECSETHRTIALVQQMHPIVLLPFFQEFDFLVIFINVYV